MFAEQRQKLKDSRINKALEPVSPVIDADSKSYQDLEHEIASWFQEEVTR